MSFKVSLQSTDKDIELDLDVEQFGYPFENSSSVSSNKIVSYSSILLNEHKETNSFSLISDKVISAFILAFIYFLVALEELEWLLSSKSEDSSIEIVDESSWNIYKLFSRTHLRIRNW